MKFGMEKPAWQIGFVVVMLALLATLATLQYRWLGQVSVGERERMHVSLVTGAERFSQDFNREITRAFSNFQLGAGDPEKDLNASLAERYDRWQKTSTDPALVKEIYFISFGADRQPTLRRFDPATRALANAEWPAEFLRLKQQLTEDVDPGKLPGDGKSAAVDPVQSDIPLLLAPAIVLPDGEKTVAGNEPEVKQSTFTPAYVAIQLDQQIIAGKLLPELAERYFKGTNGLDYALKVVKVDAPGQSVYQTADLASMPVTTAGDASVQLFDLQMDEADSYRFTTSRVPAKQGRQTIVVTHARRDVKGEPEAQTAILKPDTGGKNVLVRIFNKEITSGLSLKTATAGNPAHWQLIARHRSGSLDTFIANTKRRNLFTSFGVLLLLAVSVGFVLVAARRSQRLARRQLEFVSSVSHEFRTPLAVICSAGENLADSVVTEPAQVVKYGRLIRGEGRRLTEMVEQVLEFAGVQSGRRSYHLAELSVAELIDDSLAACDSLLQASGIEVAKSIAPNLPPVLADAMAMRQSLQNLIGNAIKYGANGGWIGISAKLSGAAKPQIEISVADHGIGISEEDRARIFQPFFRGADVVAAQIHGNGLGLTLVQRVVAAHQGRLTVESQPGQGSVFTIHLPVGPDGIKESSRAFAPLPADKSIAG